MQKFWPILLVILANTVYNIAAKQTPEDVNPFFSLVATYGIAMIISLIMFFTSAQDKNIIHAAGKLNWATLVFGLSVVALEFGYLNIYRVGWQINTASLVSNISLAVILLIVGFVLYHETISPRQICGMGACALGLVLIFKK